jgi:NMDA receptor-regulated gene protein 2 C-terminus
VFNFDSINERDVLSRTLNEIHKCVLPKQDKYRVFKTAEEIAESSGQFTDEAVIELKDPRRNSTRVLKASHELIRDYGYSSELSPAEQRTIINAIQLTITHNPLLVRENNHKQQRYKQLTLKPELIAKHKAEAMHFNKCAEIFFYRNIGELNNLVSDDIKAFLTHRWNSLKDIDDDEKYQMITMLLRDQEGEVDVELESVANENFKKDIYRISEEKFPLIERFSADDLKFYCSLRKTQKNENYEEDPVHDISLSFNLLTKLFVDTDEFTVKFVNRQKFSGKMLSSFHNPLPLKTVAIPQALEEIVRTSIHMDLDWCSMNRLANLSEVEQQNEAEASMESKIPLNNENEYKAILVKDMMKKIHSSYKKKVGSNEVTRTWKISKGPLSLTLLIHQTDAYYTSSQVPANISIKLEYQTKFGAEQMTRDELLREWCAQRFSPDSTTLRYRIDAKTLIVLSISVVSIQEIEDELINIHKTNPNLLLANLLNIFGCIQRLPESEYLIQAKVESDCKKLFIYKASENGKPFEDETWEISTAFSRKWIPIDVSTPTFIHVNHQFQPGCFPLGNRKRQLSYISKPQPKKNKKPLVDPKIEAKKAAVKNKNLKKAGKRKKMPDKMLKTLRKKPIKNNV